MRAEGKDGLVANDASTVEVAVHGFDEILYRTQWRCEKWEEDKVDFARAELARMGVDHTQDAVSVVPTGRLDRAVSALLGRPVQDAIIVPQFVPIELGVSSQALRDLGLEPDAIEHVEGNLLLNEGLQRMGDLLIAAGGTAFNNANAFIGVGDTSTAEAASQTELQAAAAATNRFYKAMRSVGFPARPGSNGNQSVDWASDFISSEANFAWNEWTVAAGTTTASGGGFLTGTTNLNRKVQSLGTKTTGTWTLTGTITFS
jgi:hypothetical protein